MSRGRRLGLVALAVVVAAVAFVIARPSSDDDKSKDTAAKTGGGSKGAAPKANAKPPQIELKNRAAVGGVQKLQFAKGATARFTVTGDKADEIHLHGYDIEKELKPGKPVTFSFPAKIEGTFEIESHEAEHLGKPALVGRLLVGPSS